jgi:diguanylate cyclase (GGDEF)-like protein
MKKGYRSDTLMIMKKSSTIGTFVKHLMQITGHRDHTLLDIAVVTALSELIGAAQARVLKISRFGDAQYVQPQVWLKDRQVISMEESLDAANRGEVITNYPCLVACLEQRLPMAEEITSKGDHVLWLPIWINEKALTCIEVTNLKSRAASRLQILEGILSVYRSYQSLLDYSERDSLTGLFNRKTFDEKFFKILSAGESAASNLPEGEVDRWDHPTLKKNWIAVVDIDHFKRVNDQFGHLYGDEVLILIANLLQSSFRTYDRVFRFGGEEFVVLLRVTTLDNARKIFERFRKNVEDHDFPQVGRVTVSLGFCAITNETPNVLLGEVDQALYFGKENGRNQVCHYEDLVNRGLLKREVAQGDAEFF